MTATPAPALTDAEQQVVDRFGIFEPEEREAAVVETVARALCDGDAEDHGTYTWTEAQRIWELCEDYRRAARHAVAAYRAALAPQADL